MAARDTEGPVTERQSIIEAYWRASAENVRAALATVVRVEGSAYRRPGARMVITETGRTSGVVSGGCLEGDVRERAVRVMRTGSSTLVKYDTTADDEIVWGLGLGCNGIVHVLIEPASDRTDHLVRFLDACSKGQDRAAFATVIRSEGVAEVALGTRLFLYPDGASESDAGLPENGITQRILTDLHTAVRSGVSSLRHYGTDAAVEIFIEVVEPQVPLVIFGAGADAVPLVEMARQLGWHTTVVDTHARSRSLERFANADAVILCRPEEVSARVTLTESTAVVLMTHNYFHDLEVLNVLFNKPARYVGCLGPRRRTERLLSELPCAPVALGRSSLGRLHAPVGMDLGAESPSEIALSIAAEILAVLRERSGGPLHGRRGSIHGDAPAHAPKKWAPVAAISSGTRIGCLAPGV